MAVITTEQALDDLVLCYLTQKAFAFDVETIGENRLDPLVAPVVWISLATEGRTDVIPMGHPNGDEVWSGYVPLKSGLAKMEAGKTYDELRPADLSKNRIERRFGKPPAQLKRGLVFEKLRPLFFAEDRTKIGHNLKFDLHAVANHFGEYPVGPYYDTLVASWLLDPTLRGRLGLADCVKREFGDEMPKEVGKDISKHSFDEVAEYSWRDAEATWRLYKRLRQHYARKSVQLNKLLDLEHLLMHSVLEMESTGVRIDVDRLKEIDVELTGDIDGLQSSIFQAVGREFNLRSNKEKQEVLFLGRKDGGLGLAPQKLLASAEGKSGAELTIYDWSVAKETLDHHARDPVVQLMLMHAAKTKLLNSYVQPYLGGRLRDGRIYGQFNQAGTETGRFSSSNPALQTIPGRSEDGKKLREIFIADPGCSFVIADYSQIEPRIIASLARDPTMIRTYKDGGDVYQTVADRMGVTRVIGKELVLSIAYGVGAARIAGRIGCTEREARDLMDFFNDRFPAIRRHKTLVLQRARRNKSSFSVCGRERPLPQLTWSNQELKAAAERQAYNHVIQGTAADIMKIAMANVYSELPDEARMLLTVHDEMVVQSPDDQVDEVQEIVQQEMEGVKLKDIVVPLVADVSVGKKWSDK